jgi:hypothetical protein
MPVKKPKIEENDFAALEKMARQITPERMRPLSPALRRRWKRAQRGRPPKAPGTKAVPTLITLDPALVKKIDSRTRRAGISRSRFFAQAARHELRLAG